MKRLLLSDKLNGGIDLELGLRQKPVIKSSGKLSFQPRFQKPNLNFEDSGSPKLYVPEIQLRLSIAGAGGP